MCLCACGELQLFKLNYNNTNVEWQHWNVVLFLRAFCRFASASECLARRWPARSTRQQDMLFAIERNEKEMEKKIYMHFVDRLSRLFQCWNLRVTSVISDMFVLAIVSAQSILIHHLFACDWRNVCGTWRWLHKAKQSNNKNKCTVCPFTFKMIFTSTRGETRIHRG